MKGFKRFKGYEWEEIEGRWSFWLLVFGFAFALSFKLLAFSFGLCICFKLLALSFKLLAFSFPEARPRVEEEDV